MKLTLTEILALIEAAEKLFGVANNAIQNSKDLSEADKETLTARIKAVQEKLPR